ncbi:hypothetical protein RW092_03450 [Paenibacillus sp. 3LSP]|uniref:hypothetical protein n=1 Tax=Paenibacillus sp. 3LSP TaxID=2800795 RepID=UPI0028FD7E57|nr:hypothetical protein [Paenibacillus sp. 3LSP]MDU0329256.1 hypothetical protein [Paenibacillus sp. 3LSP]
MDAEIRLDVTGGSLETKVQPRMTYTPAVLLIKGVHGAVEIEANDDQLAEIEYALRTYLDGIRYPETPDQQAILNHEINQSIEEEIA